MKETADRNAGIVALTLPADALAGFVETREATAARTVMVWGEHCTECAFPACYSACSFYAPREDHHCRRFERGIERARDGRRPELAFTRIAFRRWGKLESQGRAALTPVAAALRRERRDQGLDGLLAGPVPAAVADKLRWRLNAAKRAASGRGEAIGEGDVFVLEAFHEGVETWPFTVSIMTAQKEASGLFQAAAPLQPGYTRLVIPARDIAALVDLAGPLTVQVEPVREGAPEVTFGLVDFARLSRPLPSLPAAKPAQQAPAQKSKGPPKFKCLVWDLDNTLWRGVLVEDGIEGVVLNEQAVALIREFDRRGIINSIASKNDTELALRALDAFSLRDLFVFPKISWGPKSEAIREIIAEMDVGADTFAFIDDQPFERGEVAELLPEVTVFADTEMAALPDHPRFDVPVTPESGKRRSMYQTEEKRQAARQGSALDYAEFLRACGIALTVGRLTPRNLLRMYELSQRTNQLNFSGLRYGQAELEALMARRPDDAFVLSCADRFGDYGAIGFCVLAEGRPQVESFFMSCRVQRKRVENAFFHRLAAELAARGAERLEVRYKPTAKNGASAQMLAELGFTFEPDGPDGEGLYVRPLGEAFADTDVVQLVAELDLQPAEAAE
ncbi:MAG TPA: HAD-IIIC family phosphatase [Caulobacteraceae bacterium]|jgi:FkbH-like protein